LAVPQMAQRCPCVSTTKRRAARIDPLAIPPAALIAVRRADHSADFWQALEQYFGFDVAAPQ
jgi:hypothetical protein